MVQHRLDDAPVRRAASGCARQRQAQQRHRVERVLQRRGEFDLMLQRQPLPHGGRSRRVSVRSRPGLCGPNAKAARRTAPAGTRHSTTARPAPAAGARTPGRRRAKSGRTRNAAASSLVSRCALSPRCGELHVALPEALPDLELRRVGQLRPFCDFIEGSAAAFAPTAARIDAAHVDARARHGSRHRRGFRPG